MCGVILRILSIIFHMMYGLSTRRLVLLSMIPVLDVYAFARIGRIKSAIICIFLPEGVLFLLLFFTAGNALLISTLVFAPWKAVLMYGWVRRPKRTA